MVQGGRNTPLTDTLNLVRTSVAPKRSFACWSASREFGRKLLTKDMTKVRDSLTQKVWLSGPVAASSFVTPSLPFRKSALNILQASESDSGFLDAQDGSIVHFHNT